MTNGRPWKRMTESAPQSTRAMTPARAIAVADRRGSLRACAGNQRGTYGADYLERLREDWPL
jgi:hypothetical protein